MQRPEKNTSQRRMLEKDKEILLKSLNHDEDFKFFENFNYFKRQFDSFNHFKQILEENFFDYELLKAALVRRHENIVNYLLNDCCCRVRNPNKINLEETPLHLSLKLSDLSIFKIIFKKDASIYDKNLNGETPLHAAFKIHDKAVTIILDYISSCNLSFNPCNKDDVLHFHIACIKMHMSSVKLYLSLGFDVNSHLSIDSAKYSGLTPLLYLLNQNFYGIDMIDKDDVNEFVQVFINSGADINSSVPLHCEKNAGFTPLHFAVNNYILLDLVELLLKNGAVCNRSDKNGRTPLHLVCKNGEFNNTIKIIETLLLHCPGSLDAVDKFGRTPIHLTFAKIFYPPYKTNILNRLISKQTLTNNLTDVNGISLFHIVCTRNEPDLVNDFLNSGVEIDSCVSDGDFKGYTALHFAVHFNQKAVVELLLKRNARVNMKTHNMDNTPLHLACTITPVTLYEKTEVHDELQGEILNDQQINVRRIANRNSQLDIIKLLLLYGADLGAKNVFDLTPLFHLFWVNENIHRDVLNYISSEEGHLRLTETFKILLSNKADIKYTNYKQCSIFHTICKYLTKISDELMESFITAGADINAVDKDGLTPLHYAAIKGKGELAKSFLKYKANINVKCKSLKTPLQYAVSSFNRFTNKESITNCITALLENGSDFNVRNEGGKSLLHEAALSSSPLLIEKLLYYGADINVEDLLGNSIVCSLSPYDTGIYIEPLCVVFVHVQKLLAIGCYVNEKLQKFCIYLQKCCKKNLSKYADYLIPSIFFEVESCSDDENRLNIRKIDKCTRIMDNAFDGCLNELNRLKLQIIDKYTSLYNFLIKDPHYLTNYVQNTTVIDIIERENINEEYPLYSFLLKLQYKKSLLRSDVLKLAKESLMHATRTNLPDACYDSILRNLTNEEIVNLKAAVGVKKVVEAKEI